MISFLHSVSNICIHQFPKSYKKDIFIKYEIGNLLYNKNICSIIEKIAFNSGNKIFYYKKIERNIFDKFLKINCTKKNNLKREYKVIIFQNYYEIII